MRKISCFFICLLLISIFSCTNKKNESTVDEDNFDIDSPTIDVDEQLDDDTAVEDNDVPVQDEDSVTDEDLIPTCTVGEGDCLETELCLYDNTLKIYTCAAACNPEEVDGCPEGMVCEAVEGETLMGCFLPTFISGRVFNILDDPADDIEPWIEGARVVARNVDGSEVTEVGTADSLGQYEIPLPSTRDHSGNPETGRVYTLNVTAKNYMGYPSPLVSALPVNLDEFTLRSNGYHNKNRAFTDIGLMPLSEEDQNQFSISGRVSDGSEGLLITAECAVPPCGYAYSENDGVFRIENIKAGDYTLNGYEIGKAYTPLAVQVVDTDITDLIIENIEDPQLGSIAGSVQIVNPHPSSSNTSVVLMPKSTFDFSYGKGITPKGMRIGGVNGAFVFDNLPEGEYVVLAGFENDYLVRDPDPNIAGTGIQEVSIPDRTVNPENWDIENVGFKVTGAIEIVYPGSIETSPENVPRESLPITFQWVDDSSEIGYHLQLYNPFGTVVWEAFPGKNQTSLQYPDTEPPLQGYYQWRITSLKSSNTDLYEPTIEKDAPISMSEDLLGVFYIVSTVIPE
jgi:hypothetical protein